MNSTRNRPHYSIDERKRWMAILARSSPEQLAACFRDLTPRPRYDLVDRARMPASMPHRSGQPSTASRGAMTRCVVRLASGVTGTACLPGGGTRHAEFAAVFDALLKEPDRYDELIGTVIESIGYDVGAPGGQRACWGVSP